MAKAQNLGISARKLPIGDYVHMSQRKVLTVNQGTLRCVLCFLLTKAWIVFEILSFYIENKDWSKAFFRAIPDRKLAKGDV